MRDYIVILKIEMVLKFWAIADMSEQSSE